MEKHRKMKKNWPKIGQIYYKISTFVVDNRLIIKEMMRISVKFAQFSPLYI